MEGRLEKERRSAAGGWLAGVVEAGANEPFFTPVGRWVVGRGLSRVSSLSLALPVSIVPFFFLPLSLSPSLFRSSRSSLSLSLFLSHSFSFSVSVSHLSSFGPPLSFLCPVPRSTLATLLFRDLVSAAAFLFFPLSDLYARSFPPLPLPLPPRCQPRPCFAALYARAFPASPALRSDRLRIHCEIDRPKRVPEWPERTRMQQKRMGWHMRSGRFKGTPQERDATATRCIATPLSSSVFFWIPLPAACRCFLFARCIFAFPSNGSESRIF